jgi:hypothetical protein
MPAIMYSLYMYIHVKNLFNVVHILAINYIVYYIFSVYGHAHLSQLCDR